MRKPYFFIFIFFFLGIFCVAQKNYSNYYNTKYGSNLYCDTSYSLVDYENTTINRLIHAFKLNKPLPYDLLRVSYAFYNMNNTKKGNKFLIRAASMGITTSNTFFSKYYDSLFVSNEMLKIKYEKKYQKSLQKCDIYNSVEIIKLYDNDQHIRSYFRQYEEDKAFKKYKWKEVKKNDSINYFTLISIMNSRNFNSKNLTYEAQENLCILLTHSLTNDYVNPDTVIAMLKKEMLKGVIDPILYANAIDRYYMNLKGVNYYCNFYNDELPIFDIESIDKRRSEIFLYPLYLKYKWNDRLNKLPKGYKYDINTFKQ